MFDIVLNCKISKYDPRLKGLIMFAHIFWIFCIALNTECQKFDVFNRNVRIHNEFPLTMMGVLTPMSAHA